MVSAISKGRHSNFAFVNMAAFCYSLKHGLEFHVQDKSIAPHMWPLYYQHLHNPKWNPDLPTVYVNDDKHTYTELPFEESWRDKNIIVGTPDINTGYMQSHRYIQGYEKEIRDAFALNDRFNYGVIGIHQRYGDYRTLPDKHPPITPAYLYNAIKVCMDWGYSTFHCFSDEIDYAKAQMELAWKGSEDERPREIKFIEGGSEQNDFIKFMHCEGNIVSNSSFSVLAAILKPYGQKLVVCPHELNYFGPGNSNLDPSTIMPPSWYRIKY